MLVLPVKLVRVAEVTVGDDVRSSSSSASPVEEVFRVCEVTEGDDMRSSPSPVLAVGVVLSASSLIVEPELELILVIAITSSVELSSLPIPSADVVAQVSCPVSSADEVRIRVADVKSKLSIFVVISVAVEVGVDPELLVAIRLSVVSADPPSFSGVVVVWGSSVLPFGVGVLAV